MGAAVADVDAGRATALARAAGDALGAAEGAATAVLAAGADAAMVTARARSVVALADAVFDVGVDVGVADATGRTAGRAVRDGAGGELVWAAVGRLSPLLIPTITTAHPTTTSDAVSDDSTRPTDMWPVCQLLQV